MNRERILSLRQDRASEQRGCGSRNVIAIGEWSEAEKEGRKLIQSLWRLSRLRANPQELVLSGTVFMIGVFLLTGCTTIRITEPPRTATEQLLLSTAADHALQTAKLEIFAKQKVYLDTTFFDSYDSKYVVGSIRDALSRSGALLEDSPTNSDLIVEARSGALSVNNSDVLVGVPSIGMPVPLAGPLQTPELAFYKSQKERSVAKIALLAFARESKAHVYSSGPLNGQSYDNHYKLLFVAWVRTDIPEKQKTQQKMEHYQSWFPQYDSKNLPSPDELAATPPQVNHSSTNLPSPIRRPANASPPYTNDANRDIPDRR